MRFLVVSDVHLKPWMFDDFALMEGLRDEKLVNIYTLQNKTDTALGREDGPGAGTLDYEQNYGSKEQDKNANAI